MIAAVTAGFAIVKDNWRWFAIGGLALFAAFCWWRWGEAKETAVIWRKTAETWETAFKAQKSAYVSAQAAARAKLDAQRKVLKNDYDIIAERADHAEQKVNDLLAASRRFSRDNRLRNARAAAAGGNGGRSAAAGQGDGAAGDSGPGADAVVVPVDDFNTLVGNTGRLVKAHAWFKELESKGLAEAATAGDGQ